MATQVFPIVPSSSNIYLILIPILLVLLGMGVLVTYSAYSSRYVRFEVSQDGITIRGDMFGRFVPKDKMNLKAARAVDLSVDQSLKPMWRVGGTAYPGYKSGWYRLANDSKALVFLTDMHHVAYIPTVDGSGLMMSVPDPEQLITALKSD